ncbi:hypothetical protein [Nocardia asiatica]|uniref:hypothetical protein n=1 Tax=Nocardia asiatica TaxID=209252 RepID=UPI002453C70E|nr:hypothetical protein [Nocardia asiatica]
MRTKSRVLPVAALAFVAAATAGCESAPPDDEMYFKTFTDGHGRACTVVYTVQARHGGSNDAEARDIDVTQVDCEYPPAGRQAGSDKTSKLDAEPGK